MAKAEYHEVLAVNRGKLFSVIVGYEDYPKFVDGIQSAEVIRHEPGKARVTYCLSILSREFIYILDLKEAPSMERVDWELVESNFFKQNTGSWSLKTIDLEKTDVCYQIEVEFKIPVPSLILNRLVKGNLPSMVKSFERRANS